MEQSIVREIISYRFFSWINSMFINKLAMTYDDFKHNYKKKCFCDFMHNNFDPDKYNVNQSNKFSYILISHVWSDVFTINMNFGYWNYIIRIIYKNSIHVLNKRLCVYAWYVEEQTEWRKRINLLDYVLGINTWHFKDELFISAAINDYEKNLIKKLLLFKYISSIYNVYDDVMKLVLHKYLELLLFY